MTDVAIDPMRIRERAHALWLTRGCAGGSAEQDWLEAERAIVAEDSARRSPSVVVAAPARPAVAAPPASRARSVARPRISPSAAVPPTAALSPIAHADLRREPRGEKAKMASPAPARAPKGSKAGPSSRAKRSG